MSDIFEIIYRTSGTESAPAPPSGGTGGISQSTADARYARRSFNLSDLGSAASARGNLGLGTLSVLGLQAPFFNDNGNLGITQERNEVIIVHRGAQFTVPTQSQWVDVIFDDLEYASDNFALLVNDTEIEYTGDVDYLYVSGTVRTSFTAGTANDVKIGIRLMVDYGGSYEEVAASQIYRSTNFPAADLGVLNFNASVIVLEDTKFKLQVWIDDDDLVLDGDSIFDNPAAVSLQAHTLRIGELEIPPAPQNFDVEIVEET